MKETTAIQYVKRTQKDYTMSFKLQVVAEVERGEITIGCAARKYGVQNSSTVTNWLRKFGNFDWQTQTPTVMKCTPEQKNIELEQKITLLEKQKNLLTHQLEFQSENAIAERINGILKDEFELERWFVDSDVLKKRVGQTISIYNNLRPHYSCALLTPNQMHEQNELPRARYHKKIRSKPDVAPKNIIANFV